jgi:hypothetical protein
MLRCHCDDFMSWLQASKPDGIYGDRRLDRRYEIALELRWKLVRRRKVLETGTGFTVDLSSGGILFDAGRQLPVGLNVELSVAWPALLHNVAPMQWVATGKIVRSNGPLVAIQMTAHEFRTAGSAENRGAALAARASGLAIPGFGKFDTLQ